MASQTEGVRPADWLKWEEDNFFSREQITILAGSGAARVLTSGMVLGKSATGGSATAAADAGNTGDGAMGAITVLGAAKLGKYRLVFHTAAADAGDFSVYDPDGQHVGDGTVAVAFTGGGISFTLADGAADFVVGDAFTITVHSLVEKWEQLDLAASDGAEIAAGILLEDRTAPDGTDAEAVAVVREAIVNDNEIVLPGTPTADQIATVHAQLEARGIQVREGN